MKGSRLIKLLLLIVSTIFILSACGGGGGSSSNGGSTTETPATEEKPVYCADIDGDGYGDCSTTTTAPIDPKKWVLKSESKGEDCDDTNPAINPGAVDTCGDGIDNDCKDGDAICPIVCTDADGDGYSIEGGTCGPVDCNDTPVFGAGINPGATEICDDGIDNNCDGMDEVCPVVCTDADGDGYFAEGLVCGTEPDCDDNDNSVNPGAAEVCANGKDDNCKDGQDEGFDDSILCEITVTIVASDDATAAAEAPDTNQNSTKLIKTGDEDNYDNPADQIGFVKFGSLPTIPAGYRIKTAKLSMYHAVAYPFTGTTTLRQISDSDWDEYTITYNNMPTGYTRTVALDVDDYDGKIITWDITSIAASWYNGEPNFGLSINTTNISYGGSCTFASKEYYSTTKFRPNLVLTLEPSTCTDNDNDGYSPDGGSCGSIDCDDNDSTIHPTAPEWCDWMDTEDSDCDGITDNNGMCYG